MLLVTGGAGYIGSHFVHQCKKEGRPVIVLDNLCTGFQWAIPRDVPFVLGDIADQALVKRTLQQYKVNSIVHFAAHLQVEESAKNPLKYYRNNTAGTIHFIDACLQSGVEQLVFSSTCAVYGTPKLNPVTETAVTEPVSPYGRSKLMTEWLLRDLSRAHSNFRYISLRYFNVAGANPAAGIGQATKDATQLVKVASEVACGKREKLTVFGTDYPTPDGTCVRDYIHVEDLAAIHRLAVNYLEKGGRSDVFNCGYGKGSSVFEVIREVEKVAKKTLPVDKGERRAGDAVAIFADPSRLKAHLDWSPKYTLADMCQSSYEFENWLTNRR